MPRKELGSKIPQITQSIIYPASYYSFFRVGNLDSTRNAFLADVTKNPGLFYVRKLPKLETLDHALAKAATNYPKSTRTKLSLGLLHTYIRLAQDNQDKNLLEQFRSQMSVLYGVPEKNMYGNILARLKPASWSGSNGNCFPNNETFAYYKSIFDLLFTEQIAYLKKLDDTCLGTSKDIRDVFRQALAVIGLTDWEVFSSPGSSNVMVDRRSKRVLVGAHYKPKSLFRFKQVVMHEVFVHAARAHKYEDIMPEDVFEEGLAILAEQLYAPQFGLKRSFRYMAIALGWGVDGCPRDFSETFQTLWPIIKEAGKHSTEEAKMRAFDECVRAFRGGLPNVAGAVLTKDIVYMEGNVGLWSILSTTTKSLEYMKYLFFECDSMPEQEENV